MENIIDNYLQRIIHLRSAMPYVQDIEIIESALNEYDDEEAKQVVSYIALKYRKDIDTIGKMLTGVMVMSQAKAGKKSEDDTVDDLLYLRDCVIVIGAVHTGVENTIHSAIVKINRANKN